MYDRLRQREVLDSDVGGRSVAADAQHAHPFGVPEAVGDRLPLRRGGQRDVGAAAVNYEGQGTSPALTLDDALEIGEIVDRRPVDRLDDVAGLEAGGGGGGSGNDAIDARSQVLLAVEAENGRENDDRQKEIGDRAGGHDGGTLGDVLAGEKVRAQSSGAIFDAALGSVRLTSFSSPKKRT